MKLLLDENLPHKPRDELQGHQVFTTTYMDWSGVSNGELLAKAAREHFDAVITNDRGIEYQQGRLPCSVIVLIVKSNNIESIRPLIGEIQRTLKMLQPGSLARVG